MLQIGDKFIINPIILPTDASNQNIKYQSENTDIAQIDNTGTITAIGEGNTKIIVQAEEGNITKEIQITVVPKLQEEEIIFNETLM